MRTRTAIVALAFLLLATSAGCGPPRFDTSRIFPLPPPPPEPTTTAPTQPTQTVGRTAYYRYQLPTTPNKQCVYDLAGSPYVHSIPSDQTCPLTITVTP